MKRFLYTLFILLAFVTVTAQTDDLKETFLEAESYFLFEEFNEALPLYLKIHRAEPENDNINYKIGVCFLNDPYQKEKSIRYLEKASKNINPKYKENQFREKTAPPEAFFYLGNAFLVNNQIDKALENYNYFRKILDEKIYDVELVEEQIKICNTAKNLMKIPVDFDIKNISPIVNTRFTDKNPIVSGDGKHLVFVSEQRFYDATFYAEKVDGEWKHPRNIVPELGVDGDVYPTYLSYDGTYMIIYRNDDFIGNLYQSELVDGGWTNMTKIGSNINTKYWESHGSMTKDGNTLYFTSNRKGGFGGLDIYRAEKKEDGSWGEPINLGETVNTRYNEETPFITENQEYLYFSSYGHYNMGGYDVFYSRKNSAGQWDIPINLGYPINTTDDDIFFLPVDNGNSAYFSMFTEEGQGLNDIYFLDVYTDNNPRMYMISGFLMPDKESLSEKDGVKVYLVDRLSGRTIDTSIPDLELNKFTVKAPQGKYNLVVKSNTFSDAITPIDITSETDNDGLQLDKQLALETKPYVPQVLTGENSKIELEDTIFNVKSGEKLKLKMKLAKDAILYANVFVDSIQTATDTFIIDKKRFTYEIIPEAGLNTIELILVEGNGDTSKRTILIHAVGGDEEVIAETVVPITIIEESIPLSTQDSINQSLQQMSNRLGEYAEGSLKRTLEELDISKLDLESTGELLDYLASNANEQGYTLEDIDKAAANSVSGSDVDILHELMLTHADSKLKEYLQNLNPEAEMLTTPDVYMQHLRENADNLSFNDADISKALANSLDQVSNEAELLRLQMMKNADGPLKELLESLDLKALNIQTADELMEYLKNKAASLEITAGDLDILKIISESGNDPEQLTKMLSNLLAEQDVETFVDYLVQNGPDSLRDFLKGLNLEKEGINSIAELVAYLLEHANELGMNDEELQKILTELMSKFYIHTLDPEFEVKGDGFPIVLTVGGGLVILGLISVRLFMFWKRRKKEEKEG